MKDSKKKVQKSNSWIFLFLICITTCFMGIGFAKINDINLSIDGDVLAESQEGIFITDIELSDSKNIIEENTQVKNFYQSMFQSNVALSKDTNETYVTYKITVYNKFNEMYYFKLANYEGLYTNNDIIFELDGINKGDIINPGEYLSFNVIFKYGENGISTNNELESYIDFVFDKLYKVTYENFTQTYAQTYAVPEGTFNVKLEQTEAPIEVKVNGKIIDSSLYSYNNYNLVLNNVSGNIHIRKLTKYTIKNLVTNGSFENGLNNWTIKHGTGWGTSNIACHGSKGVYRVASEMSYNYISQNIYWKNGHKYYYFIHANSWTKQNVGCDIYLKGGGISFKCGPGDLQRGSTIYTSNFTGNNTISVNFSKTTDNVNIDAVGIVDLTEGFGAGNEPNKAWCDKNINYFDGTTTVYK